MDFKLMRDQLQTWIDADMGDDIVRSPFQTREYSPFVVVSFLRKIERDDIPKHVLQQLDAEIKEQNKVVQLKRPNIWNRLFKKR